MSRQAEASGVRPKPVAVEPVGRRAFEAAITYALVILAVSWVLGPIREFFVRAGADPVLANLSQAVTTLLVLTHAAGWIVRTFGVPGGLGLRLALGLGAVAVFLAGYALSALLLFGLSPPDLAAELRGPQGAVVALMMTVAAILPAVRNRSIEA